MWPWNSDAKKLDKIEKEYQAVSRQNELNKRAITSQKETLARQFREHDDFMSNLESVEKKLAMKVVSEMHGLSLTHNLKETELDSISNAQDPEEQLKMFVKYCEKQKHDDTVERSFKATFS